MEQIITAAAGENNLPAATRAIQITERIRANGRTAVNAVCAIGEDLRTMKIDNLYTELGYESFEDYAEKEFDLKRRQAYQYISVYEKLGKEFVQSNAQLGITKLSLLATANPEDRAEVMEQDVKGMTTRELEELLDNYKQQGEQLTLLQEKNTELEAKIEELEAEPKDVQVATKEVPAPDKETEEQLKKKTQELISANAEKDSIRKELNAANAELEMYKKSSADTRKKISEEVEKEKKKLSKELKDIETRLQNARAAAEQAKENAEKEKAEFLKQIEELKQAAQKPPENPDKSSFKAILTSAYKEVTGLVEFVRNSELEDRKLFMEKAFAILHGSLDALKKIELPVEIEKLSPKSRGIVDISQIKPLTKPDNDDYDEEDDDE